MELKIDRLSYTYHPGTPFEKKALDEISLTIGSGEFIGMIGHTGSGKSTLVQHLNGLIKATSGHIFIDGKDIYEAGYPLRELRCRVGLVFQYPEYQLFEADVLTDVCFGPKNQGLSVEDARIKAREAMRAVGLDESYESRSPFELSGGQKRRAAIAGILAMEPELLVLDEPTAGMDPEGRDEILNLLKTLHEEKGISIVLVSHSMEDVANYVSRIIVLDEGKIRWDGEPSKVFVHVRELEEIGLAAPQVSYVMAKLAEHGWAVDPSVTTIDAAVEEILQAARNRQVHIPGSER
ncbi:MAG TPA: energy-coupling factor transporter ATPase [Lachnospiraceae bacterium]|nr:energy-coupling factor transporter ATPase [Lachnospiraceae bacterium]